MKATSGTVVTMTFDLRTEPGGEVVDTADRENPFSFLLGHQNLFDKFEKELEGLEAGSKFKFNLTPEETYGNHDENAVLKLDKKVFEVEGVLREDMLVVGNVVPLQDQNGTALEGRIADIGDAHVVVDMNHPLAGETLYFEGEIMEVRAAEPSEIEHGHVHEDGHHHH